MKKFLFLAATVFLFGFSIVTAQKPDSIYLLATGGVPYHAITADLNNDGNQDLIWATIDADSIVTMLGNGDGTFRNPSVLNLSAYDLSIIALAAADFDNDDTMDVAAASAGGTYMFLLFSGNGDGTLNLYAADLPGGFQALGIVTGNFDPYSPLNLNADVALLLWDGFGVGSVRFYFGRGDGFFDGPVDRPTGGNYPYYMAKHSEPGTLPELDHIAVANSSSGNIGIIRSNGDRTFQATATFAARAATPMGIAWDFLDNDNLLDLAYTGYDNDSLFALKGTGLTTYDPAVSYPFGNFPFSLVSGDFTGDGHADLAAVNLGMDSVNFLLNNGSGGFQSTPIQAYTGLYGWSCSAADINNNGLPDLLVGTIAENSVGIFNLRSPTVSPAGISGNPATGANLPLPTITARDSTNIASVELMYRQVGKTAYTSYGLTAGAGTAKQKDFSGTLPGSALTNRGLEYFYRTSDGFVTASVEPSTNFFPFRRLRTTVSEGAPANTPDRSYRLVSFPMGFSPPADGHPSVQLSDDFGSVGPDSWRLFWWDAFMADTITTDTTSLKGYREFGTSNFPSTLYFLPGRSMFLATIGSKPYDGNGLSPFPSRFVWEDTPFGDSVLVDYVSLVIDSGWNMIATPYPYTIHMDSVNILVPAVDAEVHKGDSVRTNRIGYGVVNNLRERTATGYTIPNPPLLKPWRGYFLKNNVDNQLTLLFPKLDGNFPAAAPPTPRAFAAVLDWKLDVTAKSGEIETPPATLGTSKVAQNGYDQLDWELPPPMAGDLRVVFQRGKDFGQAGDYLTDIRPTLTESEVWSFTVSPGSARAIELSFGDLADVPEEFDVILTDVEGRAKQNLRVEAVYRFIASEDRHFELTVLPKSAGEAALVPTKYELYQNLPNPFNPQTLIKYDLPQAANVRLEVFNILGQKVATLVDRYEAAGPKSALWDGTDDKGGKVSSGIYLYKIIAGDYKATKKMMLVK